MAALPYVEVREVGGYQVYGLVVAAGIALGIVTALKLAKRLDVPERAVGLLVAIGAPAAVVLAHVLDVVWVRADEAMERPMLWLRLYDGVSLYGALLGVVIAVVVVSGKEQLPLRRLADVAAGGTLVAMVLGRIACALVHDHLGLPTDSPLGLDVPAKNAAYLGIATDGPTIRLHDPGFEELLFLVPLAAIALVALWRKPRRPGLVTAIAALVYASARFPLDYLRLPRFEPTMLGLTIGQWGSAITFAIAAGTVVKLQRSADAPGNDLADA
jgi:phosphatidylglycerol---prolipoprotein diacylglyceryl transferase